MTDQLPDDVEIIDDSEEIPDEPLTEEDAEDLEALLGDTDPDAADEPVLDDGEDA